MNMLELFKHVTYAWDDAVADELDPVERLVYRSKRTWTTPILTP